MAELRKNEKLKNSITEFVAALKDFAAWAYEENTPVEELNERKDIIKAFKEHRENFSIPILNWEILNMAWANRTGFWYDGVHIAIFETDNILRCGFDVRDNEGDIIETYEFGDFFDPLIDVRVDWEALVSVMTADIEDWHRYCETKPF